MKTALKMVFIILVLMSPQIGIAGDPELSKLLNSLRQTRKNLRDTNIEILQLSSIFIETKGDDINSQGLQIISSVLDSFANTLDCYNDILFLYVPIKEEYKKDIARYLLFKLQGTKSSQETTIKGFWLGYSAFKRNNAIHLADKAKLQIDEAQRLIDELIRFYTFEYQRSK